MHSTPSSTADEGRKRSCLCLKSTTCTPPFFTDAGEVKAVNGVSFFLERGKVLGIVGESGSGKSVTAYSVMQIPSRDG